MSSTKYESNQLYSLLNSFLQKNSSGILSLKTQVNSWQGQRSCILIVRHGALVFGKSNITKTPSNKEICKTLGDKFNPNLINAALSVASEKITNSESTKELIELLKKMRVFNWQQVETFMTNRVVFVLERFVPYSGIAQWEESNSFDLDYGTDNHGLDWSEIQKELKQRQLQWSSYDAYIPSMDAIPVVTTEQLKKVKNSQIKEHFKNSVDGKKTLINIADKMGKDPLKVAKNYYGWAENGWVNFVQSPIVSPSDQTASVSKSDTPKAVTPALQSQEKSNLPTVLSVDDSPIIQISIKRALQEQYNVLLADQAAEALKILNQQPVQLLLLDLTMPDIDGLQFCKTIRQIPKFQNLPIVMVTARDGLINKAKGHLAGTSRYLTKPFKPEELREVVHQYINQ